MKRSSDEQQARKERSPRDSASISAMAADPESDRVRREWTQVATRHGYSYNFSWLGVPIIQHPEDIVVLQELIWASRPDLVIETGIAHGGSLLLSASILKLLGGDRAVVGVDIDIRPHTRATLAEHSLGSLISTIEGDSVDPGTVEQVSRACAKRQQVLVILDSNHTAAHVSAELKAYCEFVSVGSYLVVMDTVIRDLPAGSFLDRPWDVDDSPWNALTDFLERDRRFVPASDVNDRLMATAAPGGYLLRIS